MRRAADWIARYQRFDDGVKEQPRGWPHRSKACWGRHTCHMGAIKALKALAEIPVRERTAAVSDTIARGAGYFLAHHVYKRSHDPSWVAGSEWVEFGFPVLWTTDDLDVLLVLTSPGYRDARMQDAVDLVVSKQDSRGKRTLERSFSGRMRARINARSQPSKWVTLNALRALKALFSG